MAQSLVEQAIAAGLEPRTHPTNASGYAGVHAVKNDKYQGRFWDSISKKQRPVPGLFDQPRDAALALAFAKLLAADAQAKGEKHTSPQKRKSRRPLQRRSSMASNMPALVMATPVSFAMSMSSLIPFAHAQPLACCMPSMLNQASPAFAPYSAPDPSEVTDDALHM